MKVKHEIGPEELKQVGEALFGKQWQSDLSRALRLPDSRRMRHLINQERPMPHSIRKDLQQLVKARRELLEALEEQLV